MNKFNKRWDIIDDSSYEEEFEKFKTRILNKFKSIDQDIGEASVEKFCNLLGIKCIWHPAYLGGERWSENIYVALQKETDEKELYKLLQLIFNLDFEYSGVRQVYYEALVEAINFSAINLAVSVKDDQIILHPRGEKEFDKKLIDEVLRFLDKNSQKHFIDALKLYEQKTEKAAIKSAESLRRALEEFLREKLKNKKGLDKNIKELGTALKNDGRDPQIRNIIIRTFDCLDKYFNENSKHKDGEISPAENEYLIYQTGTLMRYINRTI